jgi:3-oxoacyl-[acyl-carrier-protein] synthase II
LPDEVVADLTTKVGGAVQTLAEDPEAGFDPDRATPPKEQKKMDRFIMFAMEAARQALEQADWHPQDVNAQERTATIIGSGVRVCGRCRTRWLPI